KAQSRHIADLKHQLPVARSQHLQAAKAEARSTELAEERRLQHRGGDRSWLIRWLIGPAIVAEAATAFVAMEALVSSQELASGLSVLTALVGTGMACYLANRRLNLLAVSTIARVLEACFVGVLTLLRYDSLRL